MLVGAVSSGRVDDYAWALGRVALTIWAYEELARGDNWFRRCMGAAVLAAVVVGLANDLR